MLTIFISLLVLSAISLVLGAVWLLINSGKISYRTGEEAGRDITADLIQGDWDDPDYEKTTFKGQAGIVEREASVSIKEIKNQLKPRHWAKVFPVLLIGAGLFGVFIFGSLIPDPRSPILNPQSLIPNPQSPIPDPRSP